MDISFIFTDFPPISGIQRAVFYFGLLALCLYDSPTPFNSPSIMKRTVAPFYTPPKLLQLFGFGMPNLRTLKFVRILTIVFWISAAAGLLQPISNVITFLGFAFLHATNSGALGSNHSTHSALHSLQNSLRPTMMNTLCQSLQQVREIQKTAQSDQPLQRRGFL